MPKAPKDNSAEIARQQEEARQAKITQGKSSIDQAFSQFDDPFYQNISKSYTDYYEPQVQDQYKQALDKLTYNLGRQGVLQSTTANDQFSKLEDKLKQTETDIGSKATDTASQQKANVQAQLNDLYSLNTSSADPSLVSSRAAAASTGLRTVPSFSPIGDIFAGLINQGANGVAAQQNGYPGLGLPFIKQPTYVSDTGTGSVVNS